MEYNKWLLLLKQVLTGSNLLKLRKLLKILRKIKMKKKIPRKLISHLTLN